MARRVVFPRLWLVKESKSSHHFKCGVLTSLPVFVVVAVVFDFVLVVIVYFSYFLLLSEHKRGEVGLEYQCFCLFIESTEFLLLLLWFVWVSVCVCVHVIMVECLCLMCVWWWRVTLSHLSLSLQWFCVNQVVV